MRANGTRGTAQHYVARPAELALGQPSRAASVRPTQTVLALDVGKGAVRVDLGGASALRTKVAAVPRKADPPSSQPTTFARRRRVETPRMEEF